MVTRVVAMLFWMVTRVF